ncbi:bZIP transcription factor 1 [Phytophthora cinnamomi]|uniref:bZIP transcription factor 1 n=1 Tax=Phytophthora cinnamomi TaxID=4785 RepID=UPI00355A56E6|nr:bZIP transcription factor 1 [Phytophthora cinnamomi]
MAPGVIIDDDHGVETMLERWRFVSISQPNFEMEAVRLEKGPCDTLVAATKIRIVMCESMLRHTFPNLANSDRGRHLATKLLGQRFEINGSTIFTWESGRRCMLSVQKKSDVLTPIIRFLGNLEDVSFIFDEQYSRLLGRRLLSPSA